MKTIHKFTTIVLLLFFYSNYSVAQVVVKGVVHTDRSWAQLMEDPTVNFYDVQATFNDWYAKTKPEKGIKPYKRWESFMAPRVYPTGVRPNPSIVYEELKKYKINNPPTESTNGNWSFLGPTIINGSIPNGSYQSPGGNGRINCVAFDPGYNGTTNQTFWVGTPSGGLWKTTNNGEIWVSTAMDLSSIGVSHIVIDPANANNMWIATGDGEVGDTYSNGVMKSTDGGINWSTTSFSVSPSNYYRVRRLLADPSNVLIQIAFCNGITYRTTDGWTTRTTVATLGSNIIDDAEYMPGTNGATVYATLTSSAAAQIWKSTDHGISFALISSGLPSTGVQRIAIAVSNAAPNNVWALIGRSSDQGLLGVYRSTNGGSSFTRVTNGTTTNLLGWNPDFSDAGGQAFYDLSIQVNPSNANEVFVGGVNLAKSTDSGSNWVCNGYWLKGLAGYQYTHADHHAIEYAPNGWIVEGNDGGVFLSKDNGGIWLDISNNLGIAQVARIGISSTNKNLILTGMQDNGSNKFANGEWEVIKGGDGCEQIVDPTNNNIIFSSYVQGTLYRSGDGGVTWATVINGATFPGGWITPVVMDPVNHNNMYSANNPLRKSTNNGVNWSAGGAYSPAIAGTYPVWLTISRTVPTTLICVNEAQVWKTTNSGTSWASGLGDLAVTAAISCIEISPDNVNHITITLSGYTAAQKVYHSTNGGTNWTNITSNLPNAPVNVVVYERGNANRRVFIGTDIGVYYKDDTQVNWTLFDNGLPTVSVRDMEIYYGATYCDHRLRIGTYGRSVWESDLVGGGFISYNSSTETQNNTSFVKKGSVSQEILGIKITMSNCGDPLVISNFQFNTTGTTNALNDIANARLYYTGAVPSFEPIQQFGSLVANPNGTFSISGTRDLVGGDNYFWLTFDVKSTATTNNYIDAECTQITIDGVTQVPTVTAPAGNRQIKDIIEIGSGTEITYNYGPIFRESAASTNDYSRYIYLFTQTELTALGLANGDIINSLAWYKNNSASTLGNATFNIYLKNSALTTLTSPTTWATAISTMTQVYNSTTQTIPFAAGWNNFDITDFTYTGGALEVGVDWNISAVAGNPTTGPFYWKFSNVAGTYTLGNRSTSAPATVTTTYGGLYRPNMQMVYTIPTSPLPIELINFNARLIDDKVKLEWSTITETNNDYFTIEKSLDGEKWNALGVVDAAGNSNQILNYQFFDYNLVQGFQFYRLKQTDFNGKYEFSKIVSVNYMLNNTTETSLYPNPTDGTFIFSIKGGETENISIRLYNVYGQVIMQKTKLSGNNFSFDLSEFADGIYYFEASFNGIIKRYKLVKN